jgi:N-acetylmuramoyl-L-alanine amidase
VARELPANLPEPKGATRNSNGERSITRILGLKLNRVVLDAGHGGHDQGTKSKSGLLEKDLVLDVTKRLATMLRERMGTEVVLTRDDDTYLSLEERTQLANTAKADLFLSIHANSSPAKGVAGVETFYLNFSTGREDLDLATRENATSERSIADLKEVVSKIALRAKVDESREFALRIQKVLHATAAKQNKDAKDRGVKRAPFVVLIGAEMPSVLAEIGFVTNARDESLLKSDEHRDRLAEALYEGIASYAESLGRTGTQVAHAK